MLQSQAATTSKGFRVTVEGEYFIPGEGGKKRLRNYKVQVKLPVMTAALSVIRNKLLDRALRNKYPESVGYRTHMITNVESLDGGSAVNSITIREMNRAQLIEYIANEKLPIDPDTFPELVDLRGAVQLAKADPKEFAIKQQLAKVDLEENKALAGLNPDLNPTKEKDTNAGTDKQRDAQPPPTRSPGAGDL